MGDALDELHAWLEARAFDAQIAPTPSGWSVAIRRRGCPDPLVLAEGASLGTVIRAAMLRCDRPRQPHRGQPPPIACRKAQ